MIRSQPDNPQKDPSQISPEKKPRVVIITGGSRGIGYGIGLCFARKGEAVVILDVDSEEAAKAAAQLEAEGASASVGLRCDITRPGEVREAVQAVLGRFGRIDVLVNNAGICPFVEVMKMPAEVWQRTLDVNLTGAFHCTQAVAAAMIEAGTRGRIIFITSLAENVTSSCQVDYGASKAGLRMTMAGFCTALGPHGITCNAVAPGMIMTPMTAFHWEQEEPARMIKERVPMGRIGTPEDIGNAVVFLAAPESEYISGITLRVDGGHQTRCV